MKLDREKKIDKDVLDWSKFTIDKAIIALDGAGIAKIKELQKKAVFKFYLRPKILIKLLGEINSFEQIRIILKRLLNVIKT